MTRVRVLIQSRLTSSRLPAKALLPIAGRPAALLCAQRAANLGAEVVLAVSDGDFDRVLVDQLAGGGFDLVRGPLDDVLGRFELASRDLPDGAVVVRLTADNVFPDGAFVAELVAALKERGAAYLGTYSPFDGLPYGLSAEAFTVEALREAARRATSKHDREHVTPWLQHQFGSPVFRPQGARRDYSHLRCTLDTLADYRLLAELFKTIPDPVQTPWEELVERLSRMPDAPRFRVPFRQQHGQLHSELTLGTAQFGAPYGATNTVGQPPETVSTAIVTAAIAHGVTSLDCARAYGEAETRVGLALRGGLAESATVVTKLDPEVALDDGAPAWLVRQCVDASVFRSCRELGMQRLPVLLLHRWSHRFANGGAVWERLLEHKAAGIVGTLGASVYEPAEAVEALLDPDVGHLQIPYNLLDWRWKEAGIDRLLAVRRDVIVHARSSLLQGLLAHAASHWPPVDGVNPDGWIQRLDRLVADLGRESRADLCFAFVRSQPWITSTVVGMESLAQLHENLRLFQRPALTPEEASQVERTLVGAPVQLLNPALWARTPR